MDKEIEFEGGFPFNADGSRMSYDQLLAFVESLPKPDKPLNLEDVAERIDGTVEDWAKRNGYISLSDFAAKRDVDIQAIEKEMGQEPNWLNNPPVLTEEEIEEISLTKEELIEKAIREFNEECDRIDRLYEQGIVDDQDF